VKRRVPERFIPDESVTIGGKMTEPPEVCTVCGESYDYARWESHKMRYNFGDETPPEEDYITGFVHDTDPTRQNGVRTVTDSCNLNIE